MKYLYAISALIIASSGTSAELSIERLKETLPTGNYRTMSYSDEMHGKSVGEVFGKVSKVILSDQAKIADEDINLVITSSKCGGVEVPVQNSVPVIIICGKDSRNGYLVKGKLYIDQMVFNVSQ